MSPAVAHAVEHVACAAGGVWLKQEPRCAVRIAAARSCKSGFHLGGVVRGAVVDHNAVRLQLEAARRAAVSLQPRTAMSKGMPHHAATASAASALRTLCSPGTCSFMLPAGRSTRSYPAMCRCRGRAQIGGAEFSACFRAVGNPVGAAVSNCRPYCSAPGSSAQEMMMPVRST